jgi:hypothetical protein
MRTAGNSFLIATRLACSQLLSWTKVLHHLIFGVSYDDEMSID